MTWVGLGTFGLFFMSFFMMIIGVCKADSSDKRQKEESPTYFFTSIIFALYALLLIGVFK